VKIIKQSTVLHGPVSLTQEASFIYDFCGKHDVCVFIVTVFFSPAVSECPLLWCDVLLL